jgi:hemerythrin-like domain-containing protein
MSANDPILDLMNDHRLIEKVLDALDARLGSSPPAPFPSEFVEQALDFLVHFADGCHHYKEEEALFPALAEHGVPVEGGPIGMMLYEHTIGRKFLAGIREHLPAARSGDPEALARLRNFAAEYTGLLRNHIWKEDNILFKMAGRALDSAALERLAAAFNDEQNPRVNSQLRARYLAFVTSL